MRRIDLTESPAVRMARLLREQDARLGRLETRPTGVKDLGADGDVVWTDPGTGDPYSVKGLPVRVEAMLAAGLTTASRQNTVSTSLPGSVEGFPDGAYWVQIAGVEDQTVLGVWRLTGGAWVEEEYGGGLVAPTIDAGLINVAVLGARLMVTQVLRTETDPATGRYALFDANGVRVIDTDGGPDGGPVTLIALGPYGEDLLHLGVGADSVTIDSTGGVAARSGSFGELFLAGVQVPASVVTVREPVVAFTQIPKGKESTRRKARAIIIGLDAFLEPGRSYLLRTSPMTVGTGGVSGNPGLGLHMTLDGTDPAVNFTASQRAETNLGVYSGYETHPPMTHIVDVRTAVPPAGQTKILCRIAVTLRDWSNAADCFVSSSNMVAQVWVEDLGTQLPDTGAVWLWEGGTNPPPPPPKVPTIKPYNATGFKTYYWGGSRDTSSYGQIPTQGRALGSSYKRETFFSFPSMTGDLAGKSIKRITCHTLATKWWDNAGGIGSWGWHGYTSLPDSGQYANHMIDTHNWPVGQAREINLNADEFAAWQSGARRGFCMSTASDSPDYYGTFDVGQTWIEVEYE